MQDGPICQTLCPSCLCFGARYKLPEAHLQHLSYHLLVHARHWASSWEQLAISKFELKLARTVSSFCLTLLRRYTCAELLFSIAGVLGQHAEHMHPMYMGVFAATQYLQPCSMTASHATLACTVSCIECYAWCQVTLTAAHHEHSVRHPAIAQSPLFRHAVQM